MLLVRSVGVLRIILILRLLAWVVELVDTQDLKVKFECLRGNPERRTLQSR